MDVLSTLGQSFSEGKRLAVNPLTTLLLTLKYLLDDLLHVEVCRHHEGLLDVIINFSHKFANVLVGAKLALLRSQFKAQDVQEHLGDFKDVDQKPREVNVLVNKLAGCFLLAELSLAHRLNAQSLQQLVLGLNLQDLEATLQLNKDALEHQINESLVDRWLRVFLLILQLRVKLGDVLN